MDQGQNSTDLVEPFLTGNGRLINIQPQDRIALNRDSTDLVESFPTGNGRLINMQSQDRMALNHALLHQYFRQHDSTLDSADQAPRSKDQEYLVWSLILTSIATGLPSSIMLYVGGSSTAAVAASSVAPTLMATALILSGFHEAYEDYQAGRLLRAGVAVASTLSVAAVASYVAFGLIGCAAAGPVGWAVAAIAVVSCVALFVSRRLYDACSDQYAITPEDEKKIKLNYDVGKAKEVVLELLKEEKKLGFTWSGVGSRGHQRRKQIKAAIQGIKNGILDPNDSDVIALLPAPTPNSALFGSVYISDNDQVVSVVGPRPGTSSFG